MLSVAQDEVNEKSQAFAAGIGPALIDKGKEPREEPDSAGGFKFRLAGPASILAVLTRNIYWGRANAT
jgi:hypothetical protein